MRSTNNRFMLLLIIKLYQTKTKGEPHYQKQMLIELLLAERQLKNINNLMLVSDFKIVSCTHYWSKPFPWYSIFCEHKILYSRMLEYIWAKSLLSFNTMITHLFILKLATKTYNHNFIRAQICKCLKYNQYRICRKCEVLGLGKSTNTKGIHNQKMNTYKCTVNKMK